MIWLSDWKTSKPPLLPIKREIKRGNDVAFWVDKAYAYQDSGLFTETDISEIEALANLYYDSTDSSV